MSEEVIEGGPRWHPGGLLTNDKEPHSHAQWKELP